MLGIESRYDDGDRHDTGNTESKERDVRCGKRRQRAVNEKQARFLFVARLWVTSYYRNLLGSCGVITPTVLISLPRRSFSKLRHPPCHCFSSPLAADRVNSAGDISFSNSNATKSFPRSQSARALLHRVFKRAVHRADPCESSKKSRED